MKLLLHSHKNLSMTVPMSYLLLVPLRTHSCNRNVMWVSKQHKSVFKSILDPWEPTCHFLALQHLPLGLDRRWKWQRATRSISTSIHSLPCFTPTPKQATCHHQRREGAVLRSLSPLPPKSSPTSFWHRWHSFSAGVEANAQPRTQSTDPAVQNQTFLLQRATSFPV